jgi:hypothetical protein
MKHIKTYKSLFESFEYDVKITNEIKDYINDILIPLVDFNLLNEWNKDRDCNYDNIKIYKNLQKINGSPFFSISPDLKEIILDLQSYLQSIGLDIMCKMSNVHHNVEKVVFPSHLAVYSATTYILLIITPF